MDWLNRANRAINTIGSHTAEVVDDDQVSGIACCSTYLSNKGDVVMDCRIEAQEAFEMFGVSTDINRVDGQAYIEIHESWASALKTER
jgi:hypothetical protein